MEQLIPLIEFIKKNHFWLICGTVAIASVVTWYLAAGSLHQQRTAWQSKIDGQTSSANNIIKTGAAGVEKPIAHPNQFTQKGMELEIDQASTALLKAWALRRDAQESILKWPEVSNQEFLKLFSNLQPAEKYIDQLISPKVNLDASLRVYQKEIPDRMDEICSIIGAKWEYGKRAKREKENEGKKAKRGNDDGDKDTPDTSGMSEVDDAKSIVEWSPANQELWNEKLTSFEGRDGQDSIGGVPTPIQVIALQQDLWLLEAMYEIIKDVNGEADANDLAVIKRIDHVVFGREARKQLGTLSAPDSRLAPSGVKIKNTGIPSEGRGSKSAFGTGNKAVKGQFDPNPGAGFEKYGPFHGRYIDADFQPIAAKTLYDVLNSDKLPKDNLELLVAKRVPVRIAVRMNNEKIDDFIAACGNSDFAFEVKQVRIAKEQWEEITLAGITKDNSASSERDDKIVEGSSMSGGGMQLDEGGDSSTSGGTGNSAAEENRAAHLRTTLDVNVEFFGIVKIYNPVDEEIILGKKKDTAKPNPNPNP